MTTFVFFCGAAGGFAGCFTTTTAIDTFWPKDHLPSWSFIFFAIVLSLLLGFLVCAALATVIQGGNSVS